MHVRIFLLFYLWCRPLLHLFNLSRAAKTFDFFPNKITICNSACVIHHLIVYFAVQCRISEHIWANTTVLQKCTEFECNLSREYQESRKVIHVKNDQLNLSNRQRNLNLCSKNETTPWKNRSIFFFEQFLTFFVL